MLDFAVHLFGFRCVGVHLYIYLSQEGDTDLKPNKCTAKSNIMKTLAILTLTGLVSAQAAPYAQCLYIYLSQEGDTDGKNFRPELGNRNYSIDQRIY
jgi:hypothetical protein